MLAYFRQSKLPFLHRAKLVPGRVTGIRTKPESTYLIHNEKIGVSHDQGERLAAIATSALTIVV